MTMNQIVGSGFAKAIDFRNSTNKIGCHFMGIASIYRLSIAGYSGNADPVNGLLLRQVVESHRYDIYGVPHVDEA